MDSIRRSCLAALAFMSLGACTTVQTTYFRNSYHALTPADDPALLAPPGAPQFDQVEDMAASSLELNGSGHTLLGYSQFISPLLTSLAPGYATKWGAEVGAARVLMETPQPQSSNLHGYLVTYWGRFDPGFFALGAVLRDTPEELLAIMGREMNLVLVFSVVPGTPAARAGLRSGDVVMGSDGERLADTAELQRRLTARVGQPMLLHVARRGEELDLALTLAAPAPGRRTRADWHHQPWLATQATDWSALSIANLAAANMAATLQRIERDRQLHQERQRVHAQRNLQELNQRRAAEADLPTNRRGGSTPQQTPRFQSGLSWQAQQAMWKTVAEMNRDWARMLDRKRQQDVMLFFDVASNPYGRWTR